MEGFPSFGGRAGFGPPAFPISLYGLFYGLLYGLYTDLCTGFSTDTLRASPRPFHGARQIGGRDAAVDGVGFADEDVKEAIGGSAAEYAAFKTWAGSVKGAGSASSAAVGEAAVVANTNAAAAYLLGAERLFENAPKVEFGEVAVGNARRWHGDAGVPPHPQITAFSRWRSRCRRDATCDHHALRK